MMFTARLEGLFTIILGLQGVFTYWQLSGDIFFSSMRSRLPWSSSPVWEVMQTTFRFPIKVTITIGSLFHARRWVLPFTICADSLVILLMFIFISGAMGPLTGNERKGFGRKKKPNNGLKFFQSAKKEWVSGLLLLLSVPGKEFALLKK
jgi:hypothetical protein